MIIQFMPVLQAQPFLVLDTNLVSTLMLRLDVKLGTRVWTLEVGLIFVQMEQSLIKEYFLVSGGLNLTVRRRSNCIRSMIIFIEMRQELVKTEVKTQEGDQETKVL